MICRSSTNDDLKEIAKCHLKAFPDSFSSKLGFRYCRKMLSWYIEDKRGEMFHIEEDGKIIGYCGSIIKFKYGQSGSSTSMIQHSFYTLMGSLILRPWLLFHMEIMNHLPFIWKNIKLKFKTSKSFKKAQIAPEEEFIPTIGLVVIGVDPQYQGKGYGSMLLKEFERRAIVKGFKNAQLSVRKDNMQAIAAYKKNGWIVAHEGKKELTMYKTLVTA